MQKEENRPMKRTLVTTFTLLAAMLYTSARDASEKAIATVCEALFKLDNEIINASIDQLIDQGYLEVDNENNIRMTRFGEKIALQSTQNTPNFSRLSQTNPNTAFAMLFAAADALQNKHLVGQDKIVAGPNGGQMVDNLRALRDYLTSRLEEEMPVVVVEKPAKTKKKVTESA